jgi:hypothetical protein
MIDNSFLDRSAVDRRTLLRWLALGTADLP